MKQLSHASIFLFIAVVFSNCASKVVWYALTPSSSPTEIHRILDRTELDGAFHVQQSNENEFLWLGKHISRDAIEALAKDSIKVYTRDDLTKMYKGNTPQYDGEIKYFEKGKYRVVHMTSQRTLDDLFKLFEEFDKVKNANNLKFSLYRDPTKKKDVYVFTYKK